MTPGDYVVEHKTTAYEIGEGSPYWRRLILDSQVSNYMVGARALGHAPLGVLYDVVRKVRLEPRFATPVENREYTKPKDRGCKECKKKASAPLPHFETVGEGDEARQVACVEGRIVTDPGGKLYANLRDRDETLDEYRGRVRADIATDPEKYFQRGFIVRLEDEEYAAAADTWGIAEQIRETRNRANKGLTRKRPVAPHMAWRRNPDACDSYGSFCQYFPVCSGEASIDDPVRYRNAVQHEELDAVPDDGKTRLPLLTTSSARAYAACPRKYYYAYEIRRREIAATQALRFGTVFHVGLEVWWTTVDVERALEAMRAAYAKNEIDPIDAIRAEELMLGYHVRWKDEPLHVLAVEAEFRAALVNPDTSSPSKTWDRGGKIDAIVRVADANEAAA